MRRMKSFLYTSLFLVGVGFSSPQPAHAALEFLTAAEVAAAEAEFAQLILEEKALFEAMKNMGRFSNGYAKAAIRLQQITSKLFAIDQALIRFLLNGQPMFMVPYILVPDWMMYNQEQPLDSWTGIYGGQMGGFGQDPQSWIGGGGGGSGSGNSSSWGNGGGGGGGGDGDYGGGDDCDSCKWYMPPGDDDEDDPCNEHREGNSITAETDSRTGTYLVRAGWDSAYLDTLDLMERYSVGMDHTIAFEWQMSNGMSYVTVLNPDRMGIASIYESFQGDLGDPTGFPEGDGEDPGEPSDGGPGDLGDSDGGERLMHQLGAYVTTISYIHESSVWEGGAGILANSNSHLAEPWQGLVTVSAFDNFSYRVETDAGGQWCSAMTPQ